MYDPRILIGKPLKDDLAIEIMADNDLEIRYEIDLLHENMDDIYWIPDKNNGCLWQANQDQLIVVAFVYLRELEGYNKFHSGIDGIKIGDKELLGWGLPTKSGSYKGQSWVRYDNEKLSTHYSWDSIGPRMITFTHPSRIPK